MANIKVTKTLELTGALTLKVISAPPTHGLQTEDIDVTDLSNPSRMEFAPRPQLEETEIALQCEFDGTLAPVGTTGTLTVTVTKADGNTLTASTKGYVKSAVPVTQDIGGERRLLQDVVFKPDGSNVTTTSTTTTTP